MKKSRRDFWRLAVAMVASACADSGTSSGADTSTTSTTTTAAESVSSGGEATWQWVELAPLAEGPRQETSVVALDERVYVIGGFGVDDVVATVEVYDPSTDAWSRVADVPTPMHHANAAAVDGQIIVAGFLTGAGFVADGRVFAYDPGADAWSERTPMPVDQERGGAGTAALDGRVFVVGGSRGASSLNDAWVYEVASDSWLPIPSLSAARDHLAAAAFDGRIYVVGGRDGGSLNNRIDIFDPEQGTWMPGAPMPTARAGFMAALSMGRLFVAGGEGDVSAQSGVFDEHEAYDPLTDSWESLPPMPTPRHGTGAAALADGVYIPGGATVQGFGEVDTFEAWVLRP